MNRWIAFSLVLMIATLGCEKKEEPPKNAPPPPPTAEEIYGEIMGNINGLEAFNVAEMDLPDAVSQQAADAVRSTKNKHQLGPNGPEGIRRAVTQVEGKLQAAFNNRAWGLCLAQGKVLEALAPENDAYKNMLERALIQKNKPKVAVTGFTTDKQTNVTSIFIEVYLPKTGEAKKMTVREGEEFEECKVVEIIGDNLGIRIEYLPTGDTFDAYQPSKAPVTPAATPAQ